MKKSGIGSGLGSVYSVKGGQTLSKIQRPKKDLTNKIE
jgi:LysM repeat protein